MAKPHGRDEDGTPIYFCIWCGSRESLTREHVLAKKWRKYFGSPDSPRVYSGWQLDLATMRPLRIDRTLPRQGAFTWTVPRLVCAPCNNGWMSQLEDAVEPILLPAALGKVVALDEGQQGLVLKWLAKTAIVMEFMDQQPKSFDLQRLEWLQRHLGDGYIVPGFVGSISRLSVTTETNLRSSPFSQWRRSPLGRVEVVGTTRVASIQLGAVGLTTLYSSDTDMWSSTVTGTTMGMLEEGMLTGSPYPVNLGDQVVLSRAQHQDRHTRVAAEVGRSLGVVDPASPEVREAFGLPTASRT
ncbi:hypothetical protein [Oerskovia paurometabola]|uniref:hypothetical protein n=1 Tax=Oerskovia paurometabola TaxID=162170 RepID=UPI0037F1FA35